MSIATFKRFSASIDRNIADLDLAIVHPKINTEKSVQVRNAPVIVPVFTALRRGELLRRGTECGVPEFSRSRGNETRRENAGDSLRRLLRISVIAQHRAPRHAPRCPCGIRNALVVLDCGGKRSATPLLHARKSFASSLFPVRPKAPSPLPLCRRTPKSSNPK